MHRLSIWRGASTTAEVEVAQLSDQTQGTDLRCQFNTVLEYSSIYQVEYSVMHRNTLEY